MSCELCGGGDEWIKTCLTPEGSRLLVCDPCYEENASVLVIVPGDRTVTARCDSCWGYDNPREFAEVRLGGRKNAYSGTCWVCAAAGESTGQGGRTWHPVSGWTGATRTCGRCAGPRVGWWPASAPEG